MSDTKYFQLRAQYIEEMACSKAFTEGVCEGIFLLKSTPTTQGMSKTSYNRLQKASEAAFSLYNSKLFFIEGDATYLLATLIGRETAALFITQHGEEHFTAHKKWVWSDTKLHIGKIDKSSYLQDALYQALSQSALLQYQQSVLTLQQSIDHQQLSHENKAELLSMLDPQSTKIETDKTTLLHAITKNLGKRRLRMLFPQEECNLTLPVQVFTDWCQAHEEEITPLLHISASQPSSHHVERLQSTNTNAPSPITPR